MRRIVKQFFFFALLAGLFACSGGGEVRQIPIEDFFKNPEKTAFKLSPDGQYIAYLQPYKNRLNMYVRKLDEEKALRVSSGADRNISNFYWANNQQLLYLKDNDGDENRRLYAVNRDGGKTRLLIPDAKVRVRIISADILQKNEVLLALNKRDSTIFDAYRLNIATGALKLVAQNPGNITDWLADAKGHLRLAMASDGVNETTLYRATEAEPFKALFTTNFKSSVRPIGFCPEKDCLYALSNRGRDKTALVEIDCRTGKETKVIFSALNVDVGDAEYSTLHQKIRYATYTTWKTHRVFLDEESKRIFADLSKKLPATEIRLSGTNAAEDKWIVRTFTDKNPGAFYLYQVKTKTLSPLAVINTAIHPDELCAMKPIAYTASDGQVLQGYLTLPKGKSPKNLPLVVLPHGGPGARNAWTYNAEVQFLANRGYAVFQVNYRGSSGYGKKFWTAGFKQWGKRSQYDITDGVHWLIKEGIADPKRVGIYGFSFGGYSALWGLCFQPKLYACGASYSGLSNLFSYLKDIPPYYKPYRLMYEEMVGSPETDADYFRQVSPIFHTENIVAPLLVAQGARDSRVNSNETDQLVKELRKRGVSVTYLVKQKEGHLFRNVENRLDFYRHLEVFLAKHLQN
ncbi:MAG: S9 family peptidase [Sphingobacteriaceae bacterium]